MASGKYSVRDARERQIIFIMLQMREVWFDVDDPRINHRFAGYVRPASGRSDVVSHGTFTNYSTTTAKTDVCIDIIATFQDFSR